MKTTKRRTKKATEPVTPAVCGLCGAVNEHTKQTVRSQYGYSSTEVEADTVEIRTVKGMPLCQRCDNGLRDGTFAAVGVQHELHGVKNGHCFGFGPGMDKPWIDRTTFYGRKIKKPSLVRSEHLATLTGPVTLFRGWRKTQPMTLAAILKKHKEGNAIMEAEKEAEAVRREQAEIDAKQREAEEAKRLAGIAQAA